MPFSASLPAIVASLPGSATLIDPRSGTSYDREAIWSYTVRGSRVVAAARQSHGRSVVIAQPEGIAALLGIFAVWAAGCTAVVVHPGLTAGERKQVCEATGARMWLGPNPPDGVAPLDLSDADERPTAATASSGLDLDEPALILMTSGTTASPKGVVHSLRGLSARIALNLLSIPRGDLVRSLNVLPVHFGHGLIGNCLTPLAAGARLFMWTGIGTPQYGHLGQLLDAERITFMSSVPAFWHVAMRLSAVPVRPLTRLHVGSAPLAAEHWRAISEWSGTRRVVNLYGMTETANWISGHSLEDGRIVDGLVGKPWGGAIALLRNGSVFAGGEGEVLVQVPSIMRGYHNQPDLTSSVFFGSWFRTGDIGRLGEDGDLVLVGRLKDEINRAGTKISPNEIDMLICRHPDVVDACAFAIPDAIAGELVGAAVVLREGSETNLETIREWCRDQIRAEAVPHRLYPLQEIPRTERGKLSRQMVRDAAFRGSGSQ